MAKAQISWRRDSPEGTRLEVYAHHVGDRWLFFARERRVGEWQPLPDPLLEDWLALLDGVQRRIARRLLPPDEEHRVRLAIRDRFPKCEA